MCVRATKHLRRDSGWPGQKKWGGSRSVSGRIRPVLLLTIDESKDSHFFLYFYVICLSCLTESRQIQGRVKAGTCMLRVYTLPRKCQPGLMTCCIPVLQLIVYKHKLPLLGGRSRRLEMVPEVEGCRWNRGRSTRDGRLIFDVSFRLYGEQQPCKRRDQVPQWVLCPVHVRYTVHFSFSDPVASTPKHVWHTIGLSSS